MPSFADLVAAVLAEEPEIAVEDRTRPPFGPLLLAELERRGIAVEATPPPGPPPRDDAN